MFSCYQVVELLELSDPSQPLGIRRFAPWHPDQTRNEPDIRNSKDDSTKSNGWDGWHRWARWFGRPGEHRHLPSRRPRCCRPVPGRPLPQTLREIRQGTSSWSRRASQDVSFVRNLTSLSGYVRSSLTVSTILPLRAIWQILVQPSGRIARTRPAILVIPTSGIYTGGYHRWTRL